MDDQSSSAETEELLPGSTALPIPVVRFDLFTLFPTMFAGPFETSIIRRAVERQLIAIGVHDIRDWTTDRHRSADDTPYGGGPGMVMMAPPVVAAVEAVLGNDQPNCRIVLLSAAGRLFTQDVAQEFAAERRLALICGHYEGVDERVISVLNADEISIGDYVLTGGEVPAMVVVDAVARLIPGVIDAASVAEESYSDSLVEYPHYTRPLTFRGQTVPDVLLSGHHANIARWRREQALRRTARRRPDLVSRARPTPAEQAIIAEELLAESRANAEPRPQSRFSSDKQNERPVEESSHR